MNLAFSANEAYIIAIAIRDSRCTEWNASWQTSKIFYVSKILVSIAPKTVKT